MNAGLNGLKWIDISETEEQFLSKNYKTFMGAVEDGWKITSYYADNFEMMAEPILSDCNFMVRRKGKARQLHIMMLMTLPDGTKTRPHGVQQIRELLDDVMKHHPHKNIYKRNITENEFQKLQNELAQKGQTKPKGHKL